MNKPKRGADGSPIFESGVEYIGSFKEVDGVLILDENSWAESEGPGFIEEAERVEQTLRMSEAWKRRTLSGEKVGADDVEAECQRLGYRHGWTFLGTPEQTLRQMRVAFVGLNPGGGNETDDYAYRGVWAPAQGNGYFDERWGPNDSFSTIQKQVQKWHEIVGVEADESICAQFIPFRSPDWNRLERKAEALAFAQRLWNWVFDVSPASLFVTMGKAPAVHLASLLEAKKVAHFPVGWGKQTIDVWDSQYGRRIVAMPHPSRFALFGRSDDLSKVAEDSFRAAVGLPYLADRDGSA